MQVLALHQPFEEEGKLPSHKYEANTWVLVIHFGFENNEEGRKREANENDLRLLRETFKNYKNCKYEEVKSPLNTEIPHILGEKGIKDRFSPSRGLLSRFFPLNSEPAPTLFLLFILSHGGENGKIFTDSKPKEPLDFFTTFEVWDALKGNKLLENCLKINFFGPCRGNLKELKVPICDTSQINVGKNSTRVLAEPNEENFINFFSTVESTMSTVEMNKGSWMVLSFCKQLQLLKKDVDVVEFLRSMCLDINQSNSPVDAQTPQISVFRHDKTHFCKWEGKPFKNTKGDAKSDSGHVIPAERIEHYPWKNENNLYYKRGPALIFRQNENNLTKEHFEALKVLDFQPQTLDLGRVEATLTNVSQNGLMENEGSLCVAIFGRVKDLGIGDPDRSGLAVDVGGKFVPIGDLTGKFTSMECPTFAGKPKVFFILDQETATDNYNQGFKKPKISLAVPPGNNHEGFLVQICFGKESISRLISELGSQGLKDGEVSLQEVLTKVTSESRNEPPLSQIWSTMSRKLDFPKCKNIFIPRMFQKRVSSFHKFENFIGNVISCENDLVLVTALPGMGKSRTSEEIHSQLVIRMESHFVIHQKLSHIVDYWTQLFKADNATPTVESFLMSCIDSRNEENLQTHLARGKVFLILDGFDEIVNTHRTEVSNMLNDLVDKKVHVLVTSRPQGEDTILEDVKRAKIASYELMKFTDANNELMLQTRLYLPKEKCKSILERYEKMLKGFTNNPLHLQMICELYETDHDKMSNEYQIYEKFLRKKLIHALETRREITNVRNDFHRVENILTKCAIPLISSDQYIVSKIGEKDCLTINMSGIATIETEKENGWVDFTQRSYAEFMVARKILQLCFSAAESQSDETSTVGELLCQSSANTRLFVEKGISLFDNQVMNQLAKESLENNWKKVLSCICAESLLESYKFMIEKPFGSTQVAEWLKISQSEDDLNGVFVLACKHDKMAEKLTDLCGSFEVKSVSQVLRFIAEKNKSPVALDILLSKIKGWQENLRASYIGQFFENDWSKFSSDQFKIFIYPELAQRFVEHIYSLDFSRDRVHPELLPVLLENGLELSIEKNDFTLTNMFLITDDDNKDCIGALHLAQFTQKVKEYFKNTENFDSEKSLHYRKILGAKPPGVDPSSDEGRKKYYEHIDECASRLFDGGAGRCFEDECDSLFGSCETVERVQLPLEPNQKFAVAFLLHQLRICAESDPQAIILNQFLSVVDEIPRDFKFKCGCSLAHTNYARQNVAMMKLLAEKGFNLTEKNKLGQFPLHFEAIEYECFEVVLQHILKDDFAPLDENLEIPARSEEKQLEIEKLLFASDKRGISVILNTYYADYVTPSIRKCFELFLKNLLGNLFVSADGKSAVKTRNEEQQKNVEKSLLANYGVRKTLWNSGKVDYFMFEIMLQNILKDDFVSLKGDRDFPARSEVKQLAIEGILCKRDLERKMAIHFAAETLDERNLELLVKNLLGNLFLSRNVKRAAQTRDEAQQKLVERILLVQDAKGRTPLHFNDINYNCFELLLRNILQENFVPLEADDSYNLPRSEKKRSKIEKVLCATDNEGQMLIHYAVKSRDARNLELLVKNLLGNLFVSEDGKSSVLTRNEEQQKIVERLLLVQDEKGRTLLHLALNEDHVNIMLRNLLGKYFIGEDRKIKEQRSLEKQKEIASMLLVKDEDGKNPLDFIVESLETETPIDILRPLLYNLFGHNLAQFEVEEEIITRFILKDADEKMDLSEANIIEKIETLFSLDE